MAKRKTEFGKYILEATIVAFGVVLGLLLTDWNAQRKTNRNIEKTLEYIIVELENNVERLKESAEYHKTLSIEIDSLYGTFPEDIATKPLFDNEYIDLSKINSWRGIGTANPEIIMYESAQISGVLQELNITTIRKVANVYESLKTYEQYSESTLNLLIGLDSESKVSDLFKIFNIIRGDISGYELILIEDLKDAIEEIKELKENNGYKK